MSVISLMIWTRRLNPAEMLRSLPEKWRGSEFPLCPGGGLVSTRLSIRGNGIVFGNQCPFLERV